MLVVIGHVIGGLRDAQLVPIDGILVQIFNYIYTFHMPAFFFLSGMFASSLEKKDGKKFAKDLLIRIYYPCVLWSAVQTFSMNLTGSLLNHPQDFSWFQIRNIALGNVSQFWFLKALILMQIVHYLFSRFMNKKYELVFFLLLLGLSTFPALPSFFTPFAKFGIYYGLGTLLFQDKEKKEWTDLSFLFLTLVAGILWFVVSSYSFTQTNLAEIGTPKYLSQVPSTILGCAFIFFLVRISYIRSFSALVYIGQRTMPIYVLHVMIVAGTRIFMVKGLGYSDPLVIFPIALILGTIIPVIFYDMARRFNLQRWLGLG
ncbi:MAG: acyltransferase [Rhodospirillales bacterium]|nr:acyltransferase [Alphaproteobacteria bacterium]USO05558.1 MAG: acyltransferase [Rhodospirillales bacterium]